MGNPRFSSSTPRRDPVVDRYWLRSEPGWAAAGAVERDEGRVRSAPRSRWVGNVTGSKGSFPSWV